MCKASYRTSVLIFYMNLFITWMVIYPEGTRYNPWKRDVIKQSQKFAIEKAGIKPFKHVLVPRRRGLQLILNQMHDCLDVLYDVTTIFADENGYPHDHSIPAPGLTNWLLKPRSLYIYLKRIPIKQIPTESHLICQWLYERYRIKDDFIDNVQSRFYKPLHDQDNQCTNDNTIDYEDNIVMNYVPRLSKDLPTIKQNFLDCFTNEMTKHCLELEQFRLFDVLPYAVLFYGITIYWIVGFSWYGLLSYLAVGLFGTIGGHLYMHFAI
ncbi:1-acyl-sn-glycerol-3-phosphate acyltransferase epsilon [Schistosoma japonicum]|uniref:1-acyl-sn-glycerol-3-phosphate acyltransferase epsilon n=1 Tax=Schistosoma japonicum TaxID=6182 RepID=A0A4Z2CUW6_SCHJA|nr:1-acyl-sn-glycerol-3-phosphate acyltransferase epsilon [Schistosoma japonicum]